MSKKILILLALYGVMVFLAGDYLWAILFFLTGPALIYTLVKVCIIEAPSNFISRLFYGEQTHTEPLLELSHIHVLLINNKNQEALDTLNNIQGKFLEVEKLKMKIFHDKFNMPLEALNIGLEMLNHKQLRHGHCEVFGNCFEIYVDAGDFENARQCLNIFGPKLPNQSILKDKIKRLNALQA